MATKYDGMNRDDPQKAAEIVGQVEKTNYLAHTIRETECAIHMKFGRHYHIITYTSGLKYAKTLFCSWGCLIRLPEGLCENETGDNRDRRLRLVLAHELGHLVYNINELKNPVIHNDVRKIPSEEEVYAWAFAYCLIDKKSNYHRDDRQKDKFVYKDCELKNSLTHILDKQVETAKDESLRKEKQYIRDTTLNTVNTIIASKTVTAIRDI